jgi:hypothetical protein
MNKHKHTNIKYSLNEQNKDCFELYMLKSITISKRTNFLLKHLIRKHFKFLNIISCIKMILLVETKYIILFKKITWKKFYSIYRNVFFFVSLRKA